MPIIDDFKKCQHNPPAAPPVDGPVDWRSCFQCLDEMKMQLIIARTYLEELAKADFNDNGICVKPLHEPVQGRGFQQIAATAYGQVTD